MQMLPLAFNLLSVCGCWRPISWSSPWKGAIYRSYSYFLTLLEFSFTLSQIMNMPMVNNADDFIENSYLTLTQIAACCKAANFLLCRKSIVSLIGFLAEEPCTPSSTEEMEVQSRYDRQIQTNTLQYTMMIESSVASSLFNSLLVDLKNRRLPYRAWIPFNYSSEITFHLTYTYQLMGMVYGSFIHVASDTLLCGLLLQTCCQIDILECRLKTIKPSDNGVLRKCVRHHDRIYQLSAMINRTFKLMIVSQFLVSTSVLCVSLAQLLKKDILSTDFLALILYLSTLLLQIFLYCWYGNEVKLKSLKVSDTIFQVDWTELSVEAKKLLLMAMQRAGTPIEFSSANLITLNVDSFVVLVKTSYSAYNILQNTEN